MATREKVLCPRCEKKYYTPYGASPAVDVTIGYDPDAPPPALSRADNKTYVCSDCGQDEAMRDFQGMPPSGPSEWPIKLAGDYGQGSR